MTEFVNPLSSKLEALRDKAGLRGVLILCGESAFLLSAPLMILMVVFGKQMLALWVGASYSSTYALLVMLTIGLTTAMTQASTQSMLFGMGQHKGLVWMRLAEGLGIAALGTILIRPFGLWGYAFATMFVSLLINLFVIPRHACKVLEMPVRNYYIKACLKPALFSLPLVLVLVGFQSVCPVTSWSRLVLGSMLGASTYLLTLFLAAHLKRRWNLEWFALGTLELVASRFQKDKRELESSAGIGVFAEMEKLEEQSVAE
jgi:O-antigen/teichoic acid export membrane protein